MNNNSKKRYEIYETESCAAFICLAFNKMGANLIAKSAWFFIQPWFWLWCNFKFIFEYELATELSEEDRMNICVRWFFCMLYIYVVAGRSILLTLSNKLTRVSHPLNGEEVVSKQNPFEIHFFFLEFSWTDLGNVNFRCGREKLLTGDNLSCVCVCVCDAKAKEGKMPNENELFPFFFAFFWINYTLSRRHQQQWKKANAKRFVSLV